MFTTHNVRVYYVFAFFQASHISVLWPATVDKWHPALKIFTSEYLWSPFDSNHPYPEIPWVTNFCSGALQLDYGMAVVVIGKGQGLQNVQQPWSPLILPP